MFILPLFFRVSSLLFNFSLLPYSSLFLKTLPTCIPCSVFVLLSKFLHYFLSYFSALSFYVFFLQICFSLLSLFCIFALYFLNPPRFLEVLSTPTFFFIHWLLKIISCLALLLSFFRFYFYISALIAHCYFKFFSLFL